LTEIADSSPNLFFFSSSCSLASSRAYFLPTHCLALCQGLKVCFRHFSFWTSPFGLTGDYPAELALLWMALDFLASGPALLLRDLD